jgi:hypothetical protein
MISFARQAVIGLSGALAESTKTSGAFSEYVTFPLVDEIYVFGVVSPTLAEKE